MRALLLLTLTLLFVAGPARYAMAHSDDDGCSCGYGLSQSARPHPTKCGPPVDHKGNCNSYDWRRMTAEHKADREALDNARRQRRERINKIKSECRSECRKQPKCPFKCGTCHNPLVAKNTTGNCPRCGKCGQGSAVSRCGAPERHDHRADCACETCPRPGPSGSSFARDTAY